MLLMEHKKENKFSHAIMADVKNRNQHLHFFDNLKYSENLGIRPYSRFFKEVSQLNHSIEYCTVCLSTRYVIWDYRYIANRILRTQKFSERR